MVMSTPNYDFIINTDHASKPKRLPGGGNSMRSRILLVAGGIMILLVVGVIVMNLLSSGDKHARTQLTELAQTQAEIIRVSEIGQEKARQPVTKNLAITTGLSLKSDQTELVATLAKQNIKLSAAQLAGGKNAKTDSILGTAEQSNRFDEIYMQTLNTLLIGYQKQLSTAYEGTTKKQLRETLKKQYDHSLILINQTKSQ